jgi:type IV pilus assembly protein PilC
MSDNEYYGYKAPRQPDAVAEEQDPFSGGDASPRRPQKSAKPSREDKRAEAAARKQEARDKAARRKEEAASGKRGKKNLKDSTPEVQSSDEFAEQSYAENPSTNYGNPSGSSYDSMDDGLPDGYGVVRDIDYSAADVVKDETSVEAAADAEYADADVDVAPKGKRGKKPVKRTKASTSPDAKKDRKKNTNSRKKGKDTVPDDAISAMKGPELTKKQRKDAKKIDPVQAAKCFRQLALMMQVSRDEIGPIRRIAEQYKGTPIGTVFAKISTDMADNNISFSAAFDKHGKVLPQVVVSLVSVGARAGKESEALIKAATIIQDNSKTAKQVKSALSEPLFTLILTVLFLFVVLFGIIPQFKTVFDTLGKPLPLLSQILVNVSTVVGWMTGFTAIIVIAWLIYWNQKGRDNEDLRVKIDTWKLNMKPHIFADLMQVSQMAQVFGNLHTLREINMSERDTLITTARSTTNWAIRRHLLQHVDLMDKGEARFKELANNKKLFPVDAAYTLIVGEDAGQGTQTIGMMAETYKEESELSAQQLVVAIGPIANGAVGLVYMLVMLASYLPVFEMYTSIGEVN